MNEQDIRKKHNIPDGVEVMVSDKTKDRLASAVLTVLGDCSDAELREAEKTLIKLGTDVLAKAVFADIDDVDDLAKMWNIAAVGAASVMASKGDVAGLSALYTLKTMVTERGEDLLMFSNMEINREDSDGSKVEGEEMHIGVGFSVPKKGLRSQLEVTLRKAIHRLNHLRETNPSSEDFLGQMIEGDIAQAKGFDGPKTEFTFKSARVSAEDLAKGGPSIQ